MVCVNGLVQVVLSLAKIVLLDRRGRDDWSTETFLEHKERARC
jgi:hypothetical protein